MGAHPVAVISLGLWQRAFGSDPSIIGQSINLNGTTGELSGTPDTAADYVFIVKFTTATGSNTRALSIHVSPAPAG